MLSFIGDQFRKPSGFWGRIVSFWMKKRNRLAYEKIIHELGIMQDERILEIGYGHGIGLDMICRRFDCIISGIDFSELMYKETRLRNEKHIKNGKLVLNFGEYLGFKYPANSFNKIFFVNVIYFWDNLERPFKKIRDELKEGGVLCIYMAHHDDLKTLKLSSGNIFHRYSIDFVCEKLDGLKFKNIECKFDNGYYIQCSL